MIRTSAMGDVALTTSVLSAMRKQYSSVEIVLLTKPIYKLFFVSIPGLSFIYTDFKVRHKGLNGLYRLYKEIRQTGEFDYIIDLHDVLRSKILKILFLFSKAKIFSIKKGKIEKYKIIRGKSKKQLKHTIDRYCDVLARAGFSVIPSDNPSIVPLPEAIDKVNLLIGNHGVRNIGIAPYAKHKLKTWPEEFLIRLLEKISGQYKTNFWLFGGAEDAEKLKVIQLNIPGSTSIVGRLTLNEELALMSSLDLMISMDSSNMHMAALVGTKVVSIWGGTDPVIGFGAWKQPDEYSIKIPFDELPCRPCSVFGKGECRRADFACMNRLTPELVFEKIKSTGLLDQ